MLARFNNKNTHKKTINHNMGKQISYVSPNANGIGRNEMINSLNSACLQKESSPAARSEIAVKIAQGFNNSLLSPSERNLAEEVLRLLMRDSAVRVRKELALNICHNNDIPHDVICTLANDVAEVSIPILENSLVLNDEDLLEIVRSYKEIRGLVAIAARKNVSEKVSSLLIASRHVSVLRRLLDNNNAYINDDDFDEILRNFSDDQSILETLVLRGGLPVCIAETLHSLISDNLKQDLTRRNFMPQYWVDAVSQIARDAAILRFISPRLSDDELGALSEQMMRNKRLNYSLILRSLCAGEIRFFEVAIAKLANISLPKVRILLEDSGKLGFVAICNAAGVPVGFVEATKMVYRLARKLSESGEENLPLAMAQYIISTKQQDAIENTAYFLAIMKGYASEPSAR